MDILDLAFFTLYFLCSEDMFSKVSKPFHGPMSPKKKPNDVVVVAIVTIIVIIITDL